MLHPKFHFALCKLRFWHDWHVRVTWSSVFVFVLGFLAVACAGRANNQSVIVSQAKLPEKTPMDDRVSPPGSAVNMNGVLKVAPGQLVNQSGAAIQLRGVSTNILTRNEKLYNKDTLRWLRDDWRIMAIRAAMSDVSSAEDFSKTQKKIDELVRAAIELGLYIIIEWRVVAQNDSLTTLDRAEEFFAPITQQFGMSPNIIYEISFEGADVAGAWRKDIKPYAQAIIPKIREQAPNNLIIVQGPPHEVLMNDVANASLNNFENILIGLRLTADHANPESLSNIQVAKDQGLGIFVTQISPTSNQGDVDASRLGAWLEALGKLKVSWIAWSLLTGNEPGSLLLDSAGLKGGWNENDLTAFGKLFREKIQKNPVPVTTTGSAVASSNGDDFMIAMMVPTMTPGGPKDTSPGGTPEIVTADDSPGGMSSTSVAMGTSTSSSTTPKPAKIGFDRVSPILQRACVNCHRSGGTPPDLSSYAGSKAAGESLVNVSTGPAPSMPPNGVVLTESEKSILQAWRSAGFAETTTN